VNITGKEIPTPHGWFIPGPSEEILDGLLALEPRAMYDQCIVGVVRRFNDTFVLYDQKCVIDAVTADYASEPLATGDDDPYIAAVEWFEFNTIGAWMGKGTPGFLQRDEDV